MKDFTIIKRNGERVNFDSKKIETAIRGANKDTIIKHRLKVSDIKELTKSIEQELMSTGNQITIELIQDKVEDTLLEVSPQVAKNYIRFRENRAINRLGNSTDGLLQSLVENTNAELAKENANKDAKILSTQRDLMAGIMSRDYVERKVIPDHIKEAHSKGIIHQHDLDYFAQRMHNCSLINLDDMLQNGTVISGTKIDTPKSFEVAATVATQIIASVASSQYGGQSINLSALAPFVDVSRQKIKADLTEKFADLNLSEKYIDEKTEEFLLREIEKGVQTMQYQIQTIASSNGQTPFVTIFIYLNEVDKEMRDDLALIAKEVFKQRIIGIKNEDGVYVTPAFPKLIYVLQEDNITPGSEYWDLTQLAAKCTAKRMVPDYISEKVMKSLKVDDNGEGHCYSAMG